MGYQLRDLKNGNIEVLGLPRPIIIKNHYWHCPDDGTGGNAIDLLVQVMSMSFNDAMRKLEDFM